LIIHLVDDFLRIIWINLLKYLHTHLAVQTASSLDQQTVIADSITDLTSSQRPQVTQVSLASTSSNFRQGDTDALEARLKTRLDSKLT